MSFFTNFFMLDSTSGMSLLEIEEIKSKYSPSCLQRLCRSGQAFISRNLRAESLWRRPCGNFSIPGHSPILNLSREVRPSIPSGSAFISPQSSMEKCLSLARFTRFEGRATKLLQQRIPISSRDVGNLGISSKLSQCCIDNHSSWGSGRISSDDEPFPSKFLQYQIFRDRRQGKHRSSSTGQ